MDAYRTSTGRRLALASDFIPDANGRDARFSRTDDDELDVREPRADQDDGEVDLIVYVTASVQVTLPAGYTDAELAEIAEHELGWNATFVSVDRVELDTPALPAPVTVDSSTGRRHLFGRRRHV